MEITCNRCHRTVQVEDCYCPACGLPQFFFTAEDGGGVQSRPELWNEAVRDAGTVAWKPALRLAMVLAVPAGLLSSALSPLSGGGLFWMTVAAALTVYCYVRSQQTPWITLGAGARIGMVTGILGGWLAFGFSGGALFVNRFVLHHPAEIDAEWKTRVDLSQQMTQQLAAQMGQSDAAQLQAQKAWMLSPWGHAGIEAFSFASSAVFLILFAVAGGALGARLTARSRRPEV
jgi:hypothetical protein